MQDPVQGLHRRWTIHLWQEFNSRPEFGITQQRQGQLGAHSLQHREGRKHGLGMHIARQLGDEDTGVEADSKRHCPRLGARRSPHGWGAHETRDGRASFPDSAAMSCAGRAVPGLGVE